MAKTVTGVAEENSVYFTRGGITIDAAGEGKLRAHAERLKDKQRLTVTLIGHTDHLGSRSYNLAIAEQRTAAVARRLQALGVNRTQIRRYEVGHEKAATACKNPECRRKMRRVDLIYPDPD